MNANKSLDKRNRPKDIDKLLAESKIRKIEKKKVYKINMFFKIKDMLVCLNDLLYWVCMGKFW